MDTLVVPGGMDTAHSGLCHLHAEMLFYEINGGEDGQVGISLAAAGAADAADGIQRARGHFI